MLEKSNNILIYYMYVYVHYYMYVYVQNLRLLVVGMTLAMVVGFELVLLSAVVGTEVDSLAEVVLPEVVVVGIVTTENIRSSHIISNNMN